MQVPMSRAFNHLLLTLALATAGCADDAADTSSGAGGDGSASGSGGHGAGGSTTTGGTGGDTTTGGTGGQGGAADGCPDVLTCSAPFPDFGSEQGFIHTSSSITASTGFANHRGRDMFYNPGDDVWVMGKFAYGVFDDDIKDEDVDIYLLRDCGSTWEYLDTLRTTTDGQHATVEGVEDTGGWVFYQVPSSVGLGPGRHRFELVVKGDLTHTEAYVDIVPPGTPIVVSDVDGTLTTSENEEFSALLTGAIPDANADAPEVLNALAAQGYRVMYLTARPQFLVGRTREFTETHGFPLGLVHTTLTFTGATGASAVTYKTDELAALGARGLVPSWAFGNTASDAEAFASASVPMNDHRVMYQFDDTTFGSRRVDAYATLLPEIAADPPPVCP